MANNISSAAFLGNRNQGFQLAHNFGHVNVSYHISQSGTFFHALSLGTVLIFVRPGQRKNPDLVLTPPCRFGETMTLSTATRLLRSTHGVLSRLLGWHLSGWEVSGKDEA